MITDVGSMLAAAMRVFQTPLTIYGFTFSFWEVFCFSIVASIVIWLIVEVILGDR